MFHFYTLFLAFGLPSLNTTDTAGVLEEQFIRGGSFGTVSIEKSVDGVILHLTGGQSLEWEYVIQPEGALHIADLDVLGSHVILAGTFSDGLVLENSRLVSKGPVSAFYAVFHLENGTLLRVGHLDSEAGVQCRGLLVDHFGINLVCSHGEQSFMLPLGQNPEKVRTQFSVIQMSPDDWDIVTLHILAAPVLDLLPFGDWDQVMDPLPISQSEGTVEDPNGPGTATTQPESGETQGGTG